MELLYCTKGEERQAQETEGEPDGDAQFETDWTDRRMICLRGRVCCRLGARGHTTAAQSTEVGILDCPAPVGAR